MQAKVTAKSYPIEIKIVQSALSAFPALSRAPLKTMDLPGPTGESNRLSIYPRGTILCLGPSPEDAAKQAAIVQEHGCNALIVCTDARGPASLSGYLDREELANLSNIDAVALWSDESDLHAARVALAKREGPLIPLITEIDMSCRCIIERHVCIDTTASGGNASLLAASG